VKIARYVAIHERDTNAHIHRKTAVHPGEHVGGRLRIEESGPLEPLHDAAAHLLGERRQVRLGDRLGGQRVCALLKHAIGDARMEMPVLIEGRAEAVQEGDGTQAWPRIRRGIVARAQTPAGRSARKPRSRLGTEITHCRTGTGGMTPSTRWAAVCAMRRPFGGIVRDRAGSCGIVRDRAGSQCGPTEGRAGDAATVATMDASGAEEWACACVHYARVRADSSGRVGSLKIVWVFHSETQNCPANVSEIVPNSLANH